MKIKIILFFFLFLILTLFVSAGLFDKITGLIITEEPKGLCSAKYSTGGVPLTRWGYDEETKGEIVGDRYSGLILKENCFRLYDQNLEKIKTQICANSKKDEEVKITWNNEIIDKFPLDCRIKEELNEGLCLAKYSTGVVPLTRYGYNEETKGEIIDNTYSGLILKENCLRLYDQNLEKIKTQICANSERDEVINITWKNEIIDKFPLDCRIKEEPKGLCSAKYSTGGVPLTRWGYDEETKGEIVGDRYSGLILKENCFRLYDQNLEKIKTQICANSKKDEEVKITWNNEIIDKFPLDCRIKEELNEGLCLAKYSKGAAIMSFEYNEYINGKWIYRNNESRRSGFISKENCLIIYEDKDNLEKIKRGICANSERDEVINITWKNEIIDNFPLDCRKGLCFANYSNGKLYLTDAYGYDEETKGEYFYNESIDSGFYSGLILKENCFRLYNKNLENIKTQICANSKKDEEVKITWNNEIITNFYLYCKEFNESKDDNNNTVVDDINYPNVINDSNEKCKSNQCILNEKCYDVGYRQNREFCSYEGFTQQKEGEEYCDNNFECKSNLCIDEKCVNSGFFQKIINWLKKLLNLE